MADGVAKIQMDKKNRNVTSHVRDTSNVSADMQATSN